MQIRRFPITILILITVLAGVLYFFRYSPAATVTPEGTQGLSQVRTDSIVLDAPLINSYTGDSLVISGRTKGWFFEASMGGQITDSTGKVLKSFPVTTDSEWMTADFVPFLDTISLLDLRLKTGDKINLILNADNPSGDPQRAQSVTVPLIYNP